MGGGSGAGEKEGEESEANEQAEECDMEGEEAESEGEEVEDEEEDEELDEDFYNVEQISDYYTDTDEEQEDSYSIVSTPKPKLQPYFSQSYLDVLNSTNSSSKEFKFLLVDHADETATNNGGSSSEDYFLKLITKAMNCVLISNLAEFIQLIDLVNKQKKNNETIRIILFCGESYLNKYLKLYLDLIRFNENFSHQFKHYYIPRRVNNNTNLANSSSSNILASYLAKANNVYSSLFLDEFWSQATLSATNIAENAKEILSRFAKYINCSHDSCFSSL